MLFTHMVCNKRLEMYAKNKLNNISEAFRMNETFTLEGRVMANMATETALDANNTPQIMDKK